MKTYQLVYSEDGHGEAKVVEFDASDPATALAIAYDEAPGRSAELWHADAMLCTITRSGVGVWQLT